MGAPQNEQNETLTRRKFIQLSVVAAAAVGTGIECMRQGVSKAPPAWTPSEFMPSPLETRVLGSNTLLSRSKAALRIVTVDHRDGSAVSGAGVRVALRSTGEVKDAKELTLFKGYTNRRGTLDVAFDVPQLAKGSYEIQVNTTSPLGTDSLTAPITVSEGAQVLLTTDKPLYQPAQTIHLRALCLARPNLEPVADKTLVFEVEDAKGNKVFKQELKTSKFGVAAAEFVLGHEINMGRYTLRATLNETITEKKVTVEKYVLPKFKVGVKTEKKYYQPGEMLKGTVQADYFFGKAVEGGEVDIKLSTFDAGFNQFAQLKGKTEAGGAYKFETRLPSTFAGLPLEQGNALVKIDVAVTDKAEHKEQVAHTVPVAKDPIRIAVVPESGALVPGVENTIFILTSYPDGTPAPARFTLTGPNMNYPGQTDQLGIGEVRLTPQEGLGQAAPVTVGGMAPGFGGRRMGGIVADEVAVPGGAPGAVPGMALPVKVAAQDAQGNSGTVTAQLERRAGEETILLRTDKAVAKVGDRLAVEVISTRQDGTAYVDLIKDQQTVLTQSLELKKGRGHLEIDLDPTLAGTLQAHAYLITTRGEIARDTRLLYVNPAGDLKIEVSADQETYRPGKAAKLNLKVSDGRGHPVLAALGLTIVDESVFALQEMQPGMEKVYFTLEKELLTPKIEVHGFSPEAVVPIADDKPRLNPEKQKVARVLFAAAQPLANFGLSWNSFDQKQQSVAAKWQERVTRDATKFGKALDEYKKKKGKFPAPADAVTALIEEKLITRADLNDPLGTPYDVRPRYGTDFNSGFLFSSAGLDRKPNTNDDVRVAGWPGGGAGPVWGRMVKRRAGAKDWDEFQETGPMGGFGGGGGAVAMRGMAMADDTVAFNGAMPAPMAAPVTATKLALAEQPRSEAGAGAPAAEPVRVRQFFPETLFVAPNVLTDERGRASVDLTLADSITTWRMTALASSTGGGLGSTDAPLRVFQDFFVDIDLPVSLTQNDEVSIPVAVYNYLAQPQTVRLKLESGEDGPEWFDLESDTAEKSVEMGPNQVGVVYFRLRVKGIGQHKLSVTARGTKLSDAIVRAIEVRPDGQETWQTVNDRLEGPVAKTLLIPDTAIPGASNILVRIYPGTFSQIVDGLEKILNMPSGCFEQSASSTYPNILVLDYLKKTKQLKPELQMTAEGYTNAGYQKVLTYEVKGGGFSWFGDAPAHKVLTAYGILMLADMSKVFHVDPAVIARTQQWLAGLQKPDGSWELDQGGIAEGIINRQTDALRVTAYVLWALAETGYQGPQLQKAANHVAARLGSENDAYAMAVIANALVAADKGSDATGRALDRLASMKTEEARVAYWKSTAPTYTGAQSTSADIETTALAAYALLRSGRATALANKALTYLVQHKDPQGTWGSTQGTVWSLRALLRAMDKAAGEANGEVIVRLNGVQAAAFAITPKDNDVMRQVELKEHVRPGENQVEIKWAGQGSALYAISAQHFQPWPEGGKGGGEAAEPLSVTVDYDRRELAVDDTITCHVKATNRQPQAANMVVLDLGIPPGFDVQAGDLAELVGRKIKKFSLTGRQVIVYLDHIGAGQTVSFDYRVKARFPLHAKTPKSTVYEYYTPNKRGESAPVALTVKKA